MESGEPVTVNKREYSELIRKQRERLRRAREEEKENAEMASSSSSVLAADTKLVPRITTYLEKNKDKVGKTTKFMLPVSVLNPPFNTAIHRHRGHVQVAAQQVPRVQPQEVPSLQGAGGKHSASTNRSFSNPFSITNRL